MKQWVEAVTGLFGVRGGSAQGQISRGTWETRAREPSCKMRQPPAGINNRERPLPGVGEACTSEEAANDRGAKGPHWRQAESKRKGDPLGTTHYGRTGNAGETLFAETEATSEGEAGTEVP